MECFGDSSDEDEESHHDTSAIKRDASCGVLSFHANTEASLLTHVRNTLKTAAPGNDTMQRSSDVLRAIDDFCMARHWQVPYLYFLCTYLQFRDVLSLCISMN